MFAEEHDKIVNPLGVKGMGELGMVGTPAVIANAVFHATGKRIRELPITAGNLLKPQGGSKGRAGRRWTSEQPFHDPRTERAASFPYFSLAYVHCF